MTRARVKGPRIDVETAKTMLDSGTALMLDVVASHVWPSMTRTIQGSIRIPPEDIEKRIGELPRNKTIITYCT
jgi:hypothetical protein